jgi:hypothetical protein
MKTLINQRSNLYDEVWQQVKRNETEQQPVEHQIKLLVLKDVCADLDLLINELPDVKVTTETERNNVEAFIDSLFRAQLALDDVLSDQEMDYVDVQAEQEVITLAIEKLTKNEEGYGKPAVFAKRWWAT